MSVQSPSPGLPDPSPNRAVPGATPVPGEGLRERKKRLTRQLISDTATSMFLERGFEEVKVAEVAAACNVSEKTVYNYFPTKESLVLDREEAMAAAIERALGPGGPPGSPVDAVVTLIMEIANPYDYEDFATGEPPDLRLFRRFVEMFERTPSLRAAQRDMVERLAETAARAMAERAGVDPQDPEPQIAAHALLGLWRIQFQAMERYADGSLAVAEVHARVLDEVQRAARLLDTGLWSFSLAVQGRNGRDQLRAAAEAANEARKQVMTAIKQAREAWRQVVMESRTHEEQAPGPRPGRPGRPSRPGRPGRPGWNGRSPHWPGQ